MVEYSPHLHINLLRRSVTVDLDPTFFLLQNQLDSDRVEETCEVLLQVSG
jgi:hypothetical protein